jgi:hypothetical protein
LGVGSGEDISNGRITVFRRGESAERIEDARDLVDLLSSRVMFEGRLDFSAFFGEPPLCGAGVGIEPGRCNATGEGKSFGLKP